MGLDLPLQLTPHIYAGMVFGLNQYVSAFQKNPVYSQDELKYLVDNKHFIVFPPRGDGDLERHDSLTLEQYSQKIALYLSSLRNIN
ncbi:MAG: hypothetical protein C0490_07825 [Marivirga sp.]|nr:hypothetical protein [Marivirga sp.]